MTQYLAEVAADKGDMVSLASLTAFLTGIGGLVLTFLRRNQLKDQGRKEEQERKVTIDHQPLKFATESPAATEDDLSALKREIETRFGKIEHAMSEERSIARTANSNIHARLDKVMENQATSRGELTQINLNVQRLLNRTDAKPRA